MSNAISLDISSILQSQNSQATTGATSFDLDDDTFSSLLAEQMMDSSSTETEGSNIMQQLGMPAGLSIEGFDYQSFATDIVESMDEIKQLSNSFDSGEDSSFNLSSFISDTVDTFSSIVENISDSEFSFGSEGSQPPPPPPPSDSTSSSESSTSDLSLESDSESSYTTSVQNFLQNQASNIYSAISKTRVSKLSGLLSSI